MLGYLTLTLASGGSSIYSPITVHLKKYKLQGEKIKRISIHYTFIERVNEERDSLEVFGNCFREFFDEFSQVFLPFASLF